MTKCEKYRVLFILAYRAGSLDNPKLPIPTKVGVLFVNVLFIFGFSSLRGELAKKFGIIAVFRQ